MFGYTPVAKGTTTGVGRGNNVETPQKRQTSKAWALYRTAQSTARPTQRGQWVRPMAKADSRSAPDWHPFQRQDALLLQGSAFAAAAGLRREEERQADELHPL